MKKVVIILFAVQNMPIADLEEAIKTVGMDLTSVTLVAAIDQIDLAIDEDIDRGSIPVVMLITYVKSLLKK